MLGEISHLFAYCTDRNYRTREHEKNSPAWIRIHENTFEGLERKEGLRRPYRLI